MKRRTYLAVVGVIGTAGCNAPLGSSPATESPKPTTESPSPTPDPTTRDIGVHHSSVFNVSEAELPEDEDYQLLQFENLSESEQEFLDQLLPNGYTVVCGAPEYDSPFRNIASRNDTPIRMYLEHEGNHYALYIRIQDQVYSMAGESPPNKEVEEKVREDC